MVAARNTAIGPVLPPRNRFAIAESAKNSKAIDAILTRYAARGCRPRTKYMGVGKTVMSGALKRMMVRYLETYAGSPPWPSASNITRLLVRYHPSSHCAVRG